MEKREAALSDQKQSEQFMALQASYNGISPQIAAPLSRAHPGAVVLGRATIGARAQLGAFSVIRADGHTVDIGDDFFLGPRATVHIAHDIYPTRIGQNVTAGAGAVVHACDVGDDCVIGDGAVILDGSSLAAGVVLDANAVVFPRSTLEAGKRYAGAPAKPVGTVTQTERDAIRAQVRHDAELAEMTVSAQPQTLDCFVAPSARLNGEIKVGEGVGIWYGCVLNANAHTISIGPVSYTHLTLPTIA